MVEHLVSYFVAVLPHERTQQAVALGSLLARKHLATDTLKRHEQHISVSRIVGHAHVRHYSGAGLSLERWNGEVDDPRHETRDGSNLNKR